MSVRLATVEARSASSPGLAERRDEGQPRELCAGISGDGLQYAAFAAIDQNLRHGFADVMAACDRVQMILAHRAGDFDQVFVGQHLGLFKDRAGDDDIVVARQDGAPHLRAPTR